MTPLEPGASWAARETPTAAEAAAYEKLQNERLDDCRQEVVGLFKAASPVLRVERRQDDSAHQASPAGSAWCPS